MEESELTFRYSVQTAVSATKKSIGTDSDTTAFSSGASEVTK